MVLIAKLFTKKYKTRISEQKIKMNNYATKKHNSTFKT